MTEKAAGAGHPDACFMLAGWMLMGRPVPRDLPRCRILLDQAARAGQGPARHIEIALMASGIGAPADWSGALARLRSLAQQDSHAAVQVKLLDAMDIDETGAPRAVPDSELLSDAPETRLFRGLLAPGECEHLARCAQMTLRPAQVEDARTGEGMQRAGRDCDAATLGPPQEDMVVQAILKRVAAATDTPQECGESLNVLRYQPGQQYRAHLDALASHGNPRRFSTVLYLNDNYTGGETQFSRSGLKVKGRAGDALLFRNLTPDGRPDQRSLHAGMPVEAGIKWIAMRWIRERPYSPWIGD